MPPRKIILTATQIPLVRGGAEILVDALSNTLKQVGVQTETVELPYTFQTLTQIYKSCLAWRLLDFTHSHGMTIDGLISTKFPSYAARHPNKIVWLFHQHRQIYDLFGGAFSNFANTPINRLLQKLFSLWDRSLLLESKRIFTISGNVAKRLAHFNQLNATVLPPPPLNADQFYFESYGNYVFSPSRLDSIKRLHLIIDAMSFVTSPVTCVLAGQGPEFDNLRARADRLNIGHRINFLGYVPDEQLKQLYANCLAVPYTPLDEDYGFVTIESFLSRKPVLTLPDTGGPLEFVRDNENGYIAISPEHMAARIDELFHNRSLCGSLGEAGYERVREFSWPKTVATLLSAL
jgi:glycosyltransferase involved in cell wall biosynthesis